MKRKYLGKPDIKGLSALNRLYQGIDGGWLYVYCPKEDHWKALCKVLGLTALTTEPRFATAGARKKHDKELTSILEETFYTTPSNAWALLLALQGVPAVQGQGIVELLQIDPHCKASGVYEVQQHPQWGKVQLQGINAEFSETPGKVQRPAPMLGEHTNEVLLEIGYSKEQVADFIAKNLVVQAAPVQK
jgi:crotonobetainyl-CoA:carnitine CoA-transferase CaiB-like acyl-CoA transferase